MSKLEAALSSYQAAMEEKMRKAAAAKAERYGIKEYPGSWPPPRMGFPPGSAY